MKKIIRVGVMNNFNFTEKELEALKKFETKGKIFVNSNSFVTIKPNYPSIITINPYLWFAKPHGDISNVAACRVKLCMGAKEETYEQENRAIKWSLQNNIPVLLTFQRFYKKSSFDDFVQKQYQDALYQWRGGYFRPNMKAIGDRIKDVRKTFEGDLDGATKRLLYFCAYDTRNRKDVGCEECRNCMKLTYGNAIAKTHEVTGLNLSCSGDHGKCIFGGACPDCFSFKLLMGKAPRCDVVYKNSKQKGKV